MRKMIVFALSRIRELRRGRGRRRRRCAAPHRVDEVRHHHHRHQHADPRRAQAGQAPARRRGLQATCRSSSSPPRAPKRIASARSRWGQRLHHQADPGPAGDRDGARGAGLCAPGRCCRGPSTSGEEAIDGYLQHLRSSGARDQHARRLRGGPRPASPAIRGGAPTCRRRRREPPLLWPAARSPIADSPARSQARRWVAVRGTVRWLRREGSIATRSDRGRAVPRLRPGVPALLDPRGDRRAAAAPGRDTPLALRDTAILELSTPAAVGCRRRWGSSSAGCTSPRATRPCSARAASTARAGRRDAVDLRACCTLARSSRRPRPSARARQGQRRARLRATPVRAAVFVNATRGEALPPGAG